MWPFHERKHRKIRWSFLSLSPAFRCVNLCFFNEIPRAGYLQRNRSIFCPQCWKANHDRLALGKPLGLIIKAWVRKCVCISKQEVREMVPGSHNSLKTQSSWLNALSLALRLSPKDLRHSLTPSKGWSLWITPWGWSRANNIPTIESHKVTLREHPAPREVKQLESSMHQRGRLLASILFSLEYILDSFIHWKLLVLFITYMVASGFCLLRVLFP